MKKFLVSLLLFLPVSVFAHAFPIAYSPDGFSLSPTMPSEVLISFSQGIAPNGNGIDVFAPDGTRLPAGVAVVGADGEHTLSRSVIPRGDGIYMVSWHGVSSEDGHLTKGAFSFFVGATSSAPEFYGGAADADTETLLKFNVRMGDTALFFVFLALSICMGSLVLFLLLYRKKTVRDQLRAPLMMRMRWFAYLAFPVFLVFAAMAAPLPAYNSALWTVMRMDASRMITVTDLGEESNALRLRAYDANGVPIAAQAPTVLINNTKEGIGPLAVPVKDRGEGRYDIPWVLFTPHGEWRIAITFKQQDAYDINATIGIDYPREILDARTRVMTPRFVVLLRTLLPFYSE